MATETRPPSFRRELTTVDVAGLLVGATIGADIYVVSGLGSGLLGPALLAAWIIDGVLAALIALCFAQCAVLCPRVGGAYAYAREAFGPTVGYLVGWALYLAQWTTLAVFPIAFIRYLGYLVPSLNGGLAILAAVLLVTLITATNVAGVRTAGTTNNLLVLGKLAPLLPLVLVGMVALLSHPDLAAANLSPFAPLGWTGLPAALVLVYFAYMGVELVGLPAEEVRDASRALPRGILLGAALVTAIYLLVNLVVIGAVPWPALAATQTPLAMAAEALLAVLGLPDGIAGRVMALGALLSITGAAEAVALGTARLGYALARDGLLPSLFAKLHPRFGTPYLGLLAQNTTALALALVGSLTSLISLAVLFTGLVYLVTALATVRLLHRTGPALPGVRILSPLPALGSFALVVSAVLSMGRDTLALAIGLLGLALPLVLARSRSAGQPPDSGGGRRV